ncbi:MAG: MFS transporter, partial [Carnobacterium sp.]
NHLILLDVLGAVFGVGLLLFVTIPRILSEGETIHLLADSKFGLKKLTENKGLWYITIVGAIFTLIFMPAASLYPLMTIGYFNGTVGEAGLIEVVYSIGMLLVFMAYFVIGITIGLSGILPPTRTGFFYFIILNSFAGFATPYFNTLLMAMIQQSYEPNVLGRVLGVLNSLMSITGPVGLIFAGPLADKFGVEKIFLFAGIGTIICGIINFMIPVARNYDKQLQKKLEKPSK